jgi:hypothetical protein
MVAVLQSLIGILRLRAGPQDLPASDATLLASTLAYALTSLLAVLPIYPVSWGVIAVGLDLAMLFALIHAALYWTRRSARFHQTFTAVCGTGAIFALLSWPLYQIMAERAQAHPLASASALMLLALFVWVLVVLGHILRHAFDIRLAAAIALAVAYAVVSAALGEYVLPAPEGG